ncbi:hypothetical protein [Asticcacaulis benevestitus]|uniref:hypothetical protein n=1 Tax=Asticcacaulis benevestitus TaxID=347481 RepID=UPI000374EC79|nr:hypothetical protein [Asticcacaulis benevestitus]
MTNLKNDIVTGAIDADELVECMLGYFGYGGFVDEKTAFFGRKQGDFALKVSCTNAGAVLKIEPGPQFDRGDLKPIREKIKSEITSAGGTKVASGILFSRGKTNGYFRYRDEFQLIPSIGPQLPYGGEQNPSILEVSYESSTNLGFSFNRQMRKLYATELSLVVLLPTVVNLQAPNVTSGWVNDFEKPGFTDYRQIGYVHPRAQLDSFSDLSSYSPIPTVGNEEFYSDDVAHHSEFRIPDTLASDLDKISRLSQDDRNKFLHAAYWLKVAGLNCPPANSQAFVALVSSVEALIGKPKRTGHCDTCDRPVDEGNFALFSSFIDKYYLTGNVSAKRKKEFYNLRSDLAHGYVFRRDISPWGLKLRGSDEEAKFYRLHDLVRKLVLGWLKHI